MRFTSCPPKKESLWLICFPCKQVLHRQLQLIYHSNLAGTLALTRIDFTWQLDAYAPNDKPPAYL
jgi:hypothetical protein